MHHAMGGMPGLELSGPWDEYRDVKRLIMTADKKHGLRLVGSIAYFTTVIASGRWAVPVSGVYAGQGTAGNRTWMSPNPFAVNDIAFARAFDLDWRDMNKHGSSLIRGHPQGPTGMCANIEMIEELYIRGGGIGLFQGCAAGDSAMAVIVEVS